MGWCDWIWFLSSFTRTSGVSKTTPSPVLGYQFSTSQSWALWTSLQLSCQVQSKVGAEMFKFITLLFRVTSCDLNTSTVYSHTMSLVWLSINCRSVSTVPHLLPTSFYSLPTLLYSYNGKRSTSTHFTSRNPDSSDVPRGTNWPVPNLLSARKH